MPPKKRKPVVVGTVSTRSTRRESIVNIEVPKLKGRYKKVSKDVSIEPSTKKEKEEIPISSTEETVSVPLKEQASETLNFASDEVALDNVALQEEVCSSEPLVVPKDKISNVDTKKKASGKRLSLVDQPMEVEVPKDEACSIATKKKASGKRLSVTDTPMEVEVGDEPMEIEVETSTEAKTKEDIIDVTEHDYTSYTVDSDPVKRTSESPEQPKSGILDILNDWSDEGNSADLVLSHKEKSLAEDQQSLIDILEGNATEPLKPLVISTDGPRSYDENIIEECVVEDDFNIVSIDNIETSQEATSSSTESRRFTRSSQKSQNIKIRIQTGDEVQSMVFKKTAEGVVAVQDEFLSDPDNNEMHSNDSNYEVHEEHVICDSLEPIIEKLEQKLENVLKVKANESEGLNEKISKLSVKEETDDKTPKKHWKKSLYFATKTSPEINETDESPKPKKQFSMQMIDTKQTEFNYQAYKFKNLETEGESTSTSNDSNHPKSLLRPSKKKESMSPESLNQMRSNIDASISEVLRRYTSEDVSTSDSKQTKKPSKSKQNKLKKDLESWDDVRRSDRIKTILPVKKKSRGLVKSKSEPALSTDESSIQSDSDKPTPAPSPKPTKTVKMKPKSKSMDNLDQQDIPKVTVTPQELPKPPNIKPDKSGKAEIAARLKTFAHLKENQYKTDRQVSKEAKEMVCDCYLAEEDIEKNEYGCGDDCLNRLLMIECGELCQVRERCTNKKFQKSAFAPVEVFKTEKKGLGLRAAANIAYGEFILEYIGEVLDPDEFDKRAEEYAKDKNIHFYFMSLRSDAIIDATMKGNISRFINHSCDPNAETQKWTVNGELRIGFFSTRTILAGEEITFDYQFQRYGKEAQKCYCEAQICRGWLGERPDDSDDDEEEEEEEDEEEEEEPQKVEPTKSEVQIPPEAVKELITAEIVSSSEPVEKPDVPEGAAVATEITGEAPIQQPSPKKTVKKKSKKEILFEDFDQLNDEIDMLVTTGLKNQAHTLKLSRLMVRAKDLEQRKKLLRVLRRGELPCRRLFLDYHGLRLMHGYMIDAQQLKPNLKEATPKVDVSQTKLELLQTLAVLPIQNKTMLIESKVLPAVEKWSKNEDIVEDGDQRELRRSKRHYMDSSEKEKIDEIKFLATKLLEEWKNLKQIFRIPKKQRIEQMKEHEKEANRKFIEVSHAQEKESSRKNDHRYRSWSRYKSERESSNKKRYEDKGRPSAEYLKISKHERRKLFALQMELKEEERRSQQREMWRQHEINCMLIGADPRFTAPFDPSKGFQYIWNPSLGQWQALPVPTSQNRGVFNSPVTPHSTPGVPTPYSTPKPSYVTHYPPPMMSLPGMQSASSQYSGIPPQLNPMGSMVQGINAPAPVMPGNVLGITSLQSNPGIAGIVAAMPGINTPPLQLPIYEEDPSQVRFAGPIPPPAKLPPKWRCAKDKYGRPYYYHLVIRKSQWEPPPLPEIKPEPELVSASESSDSDSSSTTLSDSSDDSDTDDEDDAKLLVQVKKQISMKSVLPDRVKKEVAWESESVTPSPDIKLESDNDEIPAKLLSSIDQRLKEQFSLDDQGPPKKKRREGLCQEIIISPRTEEDRKHYKENMKKYKATKEKLKRQKEQMLLQAKKKARLSMDVDDVKKLREKRSTKTSPNRSRHRETKAMEDEHAKKIKETFRLNMANTVVSCLNVHKKPECKDAKITSTDDFKHLARKLTHHVMVKEIKHLATIDDLVCNDNVKSKAREFIKKYMSKFGEVYYRRPDEPDFID
ncbi:unnamed protein product [Ceutorhynchus assimilis]|uniref:[histone H3]-lysine(36) N-trimethyltransferase n=1 Tax=Ceutorhynchus assimilis TaxID=467358 RepID=A0A9N9MUG5_9CUCU|nr:unnamed protein product [Ceutorhynchus assimilis]